MAEFTPTTEQVREQFEGFGEGHDFKRVAQENREGFDRWLAERDRQVAEKIAATIRAHCTPSAEVYAVGGDRLVAAVADWVESPPAWVNAPWARAASNGADNG